jgi:hypothetical protein
VEVEEIALLRKERLGNPQAYGELPLIVITRGRPDSDSTPAREDERRSTHKAIASASRRGRWLVAERSGHHVQIEQPDLVVAASQSSCEPLRASETQAVSGHDRLPSGCRRMLWMSHDRLPHHATSQIAQHQRELPGVMLDVTQVW